MKTQQLIILVILAVGAGYFGAQYAPHGNTTEAKKESAYERVLRTKTLRCGYAQYDPMVRKDPNTGEMSGIAVDVIKAVTDSLGLKVEWTAEFGFATAVTDLQMQRFDATCIGFWRLPVEAKYLTYTIPFLYSQMGVYARTDDMRFENHYEAIDNATVKIISADGQMSSAVARYEFPQATLVEMPNMTALSQQIEEVATGKADVFMSESAAAELYMQKNPGKIKRVEGPPLRIFQNTFAMEIGEEKLKTMLDSALINVIDNGQLDRILMQYDKQGRMFKKPIKTYRVF